MAVPLSGAGIFTALLQYFPKNPALLAQKLAENINLSKFVSIYSKTKNPASIELERGRGGKALMSQPLRKDFFPYSARIY